MPRRSTPTGTPSRTTTSASPTRATLPVATSRGSRCRRPSGVRPDAGFNTPSASSGSPSGDITGPSRVILNGSVTRSPLHGGSEVGGLEAPLEDEEQRDRRRGQHDGAGEDRAERVRRDPR